MHLGGVADHQHVEVGVVTNRPLATSHVPTVRCDRFLDQRYQLAGGTLTGFGIVNAEITGGSTITATGGVLTVGNAASTRGSVFLDVLLDGDYDDSGDVALGDLNLVLFDWNEDGSVLTTDWIHQRPASGTTVGLEELNGVLFNWGNSAAVATVPEPAAGRLSVLRVLALGIRRRR